MYITEADLTSNGITWDSWYLASLIARSEAIFNTLIGYEDGIMDAEYTEEFFDVHWDTIFNMRQLKPTSLTTINGDAITDYKFIGKKLYLKDWVSSVDAFPYVCTIVYQAWYEIVPEDVKQVVLSLAGYINNTKNSQGISNFRQDLLTVAYNTTDISSYIESTGQSSIINKYKNFYAYSL